MVAGPNPDGGPSLNSSQDANPPITRRRILKAAAAGAGVAALAPLRALAPLQALAFQTKSAGPTAKVFDVLKYGAAGVTLRNCEVAWEPNPPDSFTYAVEAKDTTGLKIQDLTGGPAQTSLGKAVSIS